MNYRFILSLLAIHAALSAQKTPWDIDPIVMQFSPTQRASAIKKFAPEGRLHVDEEYFPMNIDLFLKEVELRDDKDRVLIPQGQVTAQKLAHYNQLAQKNYYLNVADSVKKGTPPDKNNRVHAPLYAHLVPRAGGAIIQYLFFYPHNGPFQIGELPARVDKVINLFTDKTQIGIHVADWEHINVYVTGPNPDTLQIEDVYFARHRPSQDGGFEKPEISNGTHPVVYISKWGHASHPHYKPLAGADPLSNNGPIWPTWENVIDVGTKEIPTPGNEWLTYAGYWGQTPSGDGKDSPPGPAVQDWFRTSAIQTRPAYNENPYARVNVESTPTHKNNTRNSPDFEINEDMPTFIRKLIWEITVQTPGIKAEDITYDIYDANNKLLFANLSGPRARTPLKKEKFHIGNVRTPDNKVLKFQLTLRGLFD